MTTTNYVTRAIDRLRELLPDCEFDLLRFYGLLVLTKGTQTTLGDVHDAWACWRAVTKPDHKLLVPDGELSFSDAEKDLEYVLGIRQVAAEMALSKEPHPA